MSGAADREEGVSVKSVGLEGFDADYRETVFRGDCIWCEAVSYTHLDVYKRQVYII